MTALCCDQAGPLTTIQDQGRLGWQRYGITPAGAIDPPAYHAANLLVGNPLGAAALELTLAGGSWRAEGGTLRLAVTGADFPLDLDGAPLAMWRGFRLEPGQVLRIGAARQGLRGYLAVRGGIATPPVLGSRATHLRSGLGGLAGRAIQSGDHVPVGPDAGGNGPDRYLDPRHLPAASGPLRFVPGPQADLFTAEARAALVAGGYVIAADSDRMGYRLQGAALPHLRGADIVSDGIVAGAIQVPAAQQPIILLADRQSTGGYPKIGCVITADLPRLAQMRPGAEVRFTAISPAEAIHLTRRHLAQLTNLASQITQWRDDADLSSARLLGLNLIDGAFAE